ncbi:MAG: hypothetical protein WC650_02375 [Candidatus Doudnabacteria bacterium]
MTPEAKIWLILKNLNDALTIAPSKNLALLNAKDLEKLMAREEHEQILEKLVKDYKVVDIQKKPDYQKSFFYKCKITDSDEFNKILEDAHIKYFGSLGMLTGDNFLSVVDVATDIMNELQMTKGDETVIPLFPSIVRFSNLMPADSINLRDRYCDLRWKAVIYLRDNEYIKNFKLLNQAYGNFHRWDFEIKISLNRIKFYKFYEQLITTYNRRVKFRSEEKKIKKENEALDYTDTASRRAWEKKWDTLQVIWTIYESNNKPNQLLVPIKRLTIKDRIILEIEGLLNGFEDDGCFDWCRGTENYEIKNINHNLFAETYKKTGLIYDKFAKIYRERVSDKNIEDKQPTQKIEIVGGKIEIEGLQDGLKAIAQTKKEDKNQFPYKLPAGTKWENFTIKFEDDENVFIQVKQFKYSADYRKMGMVGRGKNPNPSEAWTFLKVLSQVNNELTIKDAEARDKYKKQKELLAKALQKYFLLDYDPFYPYHSSTEKSGNSYKIKITLIPPPDKKEKADTNKDDNDDLGIKEYFNKQTPQIYEDQ